MVFQLDRRIALCYTLGWFWSVFWAAHGRTYFSVSGVLFFLFLQLRWIRDTGMAGYMQDRILVALSIPLGCLVEMFLQGTGSIMYAHHSTLFPPLWTLSLYPLFVLAFIHPLRDLHAHTLLCFMVGLVGGPLSYQAGIALGVDLTLMHPKWFSLGIIGLIWGAFLCVLAKCVRSVQIAVASALQDQQATDCLDLLYDGACPICRREIGLLQKKAYSQVRYIDISSQEFFQFGYRGIDYQTAMKQIHAIDEKGNVLVGIAVFAAIYARSGHWIASTLLRIPWIQTILQPLYRLFAKNRLWLSGRETPRK